MSLTYKLNNQKAGAIKLKRVETEYSKVAEEYQKEYDGFVTNINVLKTNMATEKTEVLAAIDAYKAIIKNFEDSKKIGSNTFKIPNNTSPNSVKPIKEQIQKDYKEFLEYKTKYVDTKNLLNTKQASLSKILSDADKELKNLTGETFEIKDKENGSKEINNTVKGKANNGTNLSRDKYLKGKILEKMQKKANSVGSALLSKIEETKGELADSYIDLWESQWFDSDGNGTKDLNLATAVNVLDTKWNEIGDYLKETILTVFLDYYKTIISKKQGSFEAELVKFNAEIAKVKSNGNMNNVNIDLISGFFVTMESENELLKSYFAELNSIFTKNKNTFLSNGTANPNNNNFRKKTNANSPNKFYADLLAQIDKLNNKMNDLDNQMSEGKKKFINSTTADKVALSKKFTEIKNEIVSTLNGCMKRATEKLEDRGTKNVIDKLAKLSAKVILPNPKKILGNNVSNSVKSINNATKEQRAKLETTLAELSTGLAEIGKISPLNNKSNNSISTVINPAVSPAAVGNNGKNWRNNILAKFPTGTAVTYRSSNNKTNMSGKMGNKQNTRPAKNGTTKKAIKIASNTGKNNAMLLSTNNVEKRKVALKA
jgi:hypothetical protein